MVDSYFVYVGDEIHKWRFVHFCATALDGHDAIAQTWSEAIDMGDAPEGDYMAVPASQITTVTAGSVARG